jgi:DNA polymerase-3 subunit epsilon
VGLNSNKFDIPLFAEEFLRADVDFDLKSAHCCCTGDFS